MIKGIDISMHNGSIDFTGVKNDGVSVVIIKATEGVEYVDPYLERHYNGACGTGLGIGFYHFMSEKTDPAQQAIDFWNAIKDKEFNVLPCLDIETNSRGRSTAEITDRCLEFLEKFKALSDYSCMIYTGGFFGRDNLDNRIKSYPGWIAHYGVDTPMETGFHVVGHQFTESGSVNGVYSDCCDVNNFTEEIFLNNNTKEDDKSINAIVAVPFTHFHDKVTAESLAEYLKCSVIDANTPFDYSKYTHVYCIGCPDKLGFTSYATKIFTGSDRWETSRLVEQFIKNELNN